MTTVPGLLAGNPLRAAADAGRWAWCNGAVTRGMRTIPEAMPVVLTYERAALAVMLATPADFEDFALGFSLTEGIVERPEQIEELTIVRVDTGVELRMWLAADRSQVVETRRRHLAGPSGCGLCGIESLAEAIRSPPPVASRAQFAAAETAVAMAALPAAQTLNQATRAVHAAGFWQPGCGLIAVREDVGPHNALGKPAGALARAHVAAAACSCPADCRWSWSGRRQRLAHRWSLQCRRRQRSRSAWRPTPASHCSAWRGRTDSKFTRTPNASPWPRRRESAQHVA